MATVRTIRHADAGTARPNSSPTELPSPGEALECVLDHTAALSAAPVSLQDATGCVLAEDVMSDRDYPPFDRSMMDGYAVRLADAGKPVREAAQTLAGESHARPFQAGEAVAVMTGAPCPPGTEAVVPWEATSRDGDAIELPRSIRPGQNIVRAGTECTEGEVVIRPGVRITSLVIALLASFGYESVRVIPKPRCLIVTTGSELVPVHERPEDSAIRNSNQPMAAAMLADDGIESVRLEHVFDDPRRTEAILAEADEDCIIFCGGISAGRSDFVPGAMLSQGAEILVHKVAQKPGKPFFFAKRDCQLIFGLPGNPLACHVCAHVYALPALRRMQSKPCHHAGGTGTLSAALSEKKGRTEFVLCHVSAEDGHWRVTPAGVRGSADIYNAANANALLGLEPGAEFPAGQEVAFEWLGFAL